MIDCLSNLSCYRPTVRESDERERVIWLSLSFIFTVYFAACEAAVLQVLFSHPPLLACPRVHSPEDRDRVSEKEDEIEWKTDERG